LLLRTSGAGEVRASTGFELRVEDLPLTSPPTSEELEMLNRIDPEGVRRSEF